jgi:DNA mismatch repair protein MutS
MQQFWDAKQANPDCLLLFRMGDFYETFYEDAVTVSRELELTLTARDKGAGGTGIPMAGVPHHAVNGYIARLVEKGYKVAVCDQMEDPALARGLVRREVTRVVTPGVVLDVESLSAGQPNYLLGLAGAGSGPFGLAYLDISTGEFWASEADGPARLLDELARIEPRELRLTPTAGEALAERLASRTGWLVETVPATELPGERGVQRLLDVRRPLAGGAGQSAGLSHLQAVESFGFTQPALVAQAAALVLGYIERTQKRVAEHVAGLRCYSLAGAMILDETTRANLELDRTLIGGKRQGSLLGLVDRTRTPMGARLLRRWLGYPLLDVAAIDERLGAVAELVEKPSLRVALEEVLARLADLERLAGRLGSQVASPRELKALQTSAELLPRLRAALLAQAQAPLLQSRAATLDTLDDLGRLVAEAVVDDPPAHAREGGVIRVGRDAALDELIRLSTGGKDVLLELEATERQSTGISSLKLRYNKVFGYYLEVTRPNLHLVPERYLRKQTMVNAERFYTPELKEWEEKILSAEEKRIALEAALFEELRGRLAGEVGRIQAAARVIAELDVLVGFAALAERQGYVRPVVDEGEGLVIEEGRHPVVEALQKSPFVPNTIELDCREQQLLIITGPNMAGKSTAMRQTALIVLLAQIGSFVPAAAAHIGIVDRIFARVGAADNLAQGRSTFMVEMMETASILAHATRRSLLVLDEIGRGTSTFDGVSIAWAVAEHIHDRLGARTVFATHYHELTELALTRSRVRNWSVAVKEWQDEVVFLRKLVPGATGRSYGIQVARLAGLPTTVVERAREVLANLEANQIDASARPALARSRTESAAAPAGPRQLDLFAPAALPPRVVQLLQNVDPDTLSPRDALLLVYQLRQELVAGQP